MNIHEERTMNIIENTFTLKQSFPRSPLTMLVKVSKHQKLFKLSWSCSVFDPEN